MDAGDKTFAEAALVAGTGCMMARTDAVAEPNRKQQLFSGLNFQNVGNSTNTD
jgi:hypothetical protein